MTIEFRLGAPPNVTLGGIYGQRTSTTAVRITVVDLPNSGFWPGGVTFEVTLAQSLMVVQTRTAAHPRLVGSSRTKILR